MSSSSSGLGLALLSAATFGSSGAFGSSLLATGWSPAAAISCRILIAAAALTGPALLALRGRWPVLRRNAGVISGYGLLAITVAQLCFFNAVRYLPVGVALLLEYLGVLLVVGWLWLRHGQRPTPLTGAGAATAIVGLLLVLDLHQPGGLDPLGVLWGLGAALGLAGYYVLSARTEAELPPVALAWAGMVVGGLSLLLAGLAGLAPLQASTASVTLAQHRWSWLVPVLGMALLAAALAYAAGIAAARRLGARLASFVGLTEVLFAVLISWLLLGQLPQPVQLAGGALIVAGVAIVKAAEPADRPPVATEPVPG